MSHPVSPSPRPNLWAFSQPALISPMRWLSRSLVCIAALSALTACNGGRLGEAANELPLNQPRADDVADIGDTETLTNYRAAVAKRIVAPNESQVAGEEEVRLLGQTTLQNFHLGGFGLGPLQSYPDPINIDLTDPIGAANYVRADGESEYIWVRVLLLEDISSDTRLAFVTLDAIGAGNVIQNGVRNAVASVTDIAPENVYFGQTHSHAGPDLQGLWGGVPASWIVDLYANVSDAAQEAAAAMRPVTLSLKQFETYEFNNYRRPRVFPDEDADPTASLLRARDAETGDLVVSLMQYNAHPTSVGTDNDPRVPHPDYVLGLEESLEADGGMAMYFNGPIADASGSGGGCENPDELELDDYVRVRCRGEALASAMLLAEAQTIEITGPLTVRNVQAQLPISNPILLAAALIGSFNRYLDYSLVPLSSVPFLAEQVGILPQVIPIATVSVSRISFGDQLEIVTIPGETTNTFGQYIKSLAPDTPMILMGLTQDSMGYILPEEEFNYVDATGGTGLILPFTNYEEYVSMGPLTAPLLRVQAYNPLFDMPLDANLPPSLAACYTDAGNERCLLDDVSAQLSYIMASYADRCKEQLGEDNQICGLLAMGNLYGTGGLLDLSSLVDLENTPISLSEAMKTERGGDLKNLLDDLLAPLMQPVNL